MPMKWRAFFGWCWLVFSASAFSNWQLNMPEGVTEISRSVHQLHMIIFYVCVVIGILVFGVMFWSVFHHRKSRDVKAISFHENTAVELVWTAVPFAILVVMAIPATSTLKAMYDTHEADIDIQVTGYQWKWRYHYLNEGVDYFSNLATPWDQINNKEAKGEHYLLEVDNPMVVPINKKIRFLFTSNDVIHSWWVPDLAIKKDTIPGFINEAWTIIEKPGVYRGQCTELCGKHHGYMPVVVYAVAQENYDHWLEKQRQAQLEAQSIIEMSYEALYQLGETVYAKNCAACHQTNGQGMPPVFPSLHVSAMVKTQDPTDHINIVLKGKPGTAMAAFGEQLSLAELAAVVTYERNAWGAHQQQAVTPAQVHALKSKATLGQ